MQELLCLSVTWNTGRRNVLSQPQLQNSLVPSLRCKVRFCKVALRRGRRLADAASVFQKQGGLKTGETSCGRRIGVPNGFCIFALLGTQVEVTS